jgi:hypothetical protein
MFRFSVAAIGLRDESEDLIGGQRDDAEHLLFLFHQIEKRLDGSDGTSPSRFLAHVSRVRRTRFTGVRLFFRELLQPVACQHDAAICLGNDLKIKFVFRLHGSGETMVHEPRPHHFRATG